MSNPTAVFEPLPNSSPGNPTTFYVVRFNLEPGQLQIPRAGAGTSLFLREDGTWANPAAGGGSLVMSVTDITGQDLVDWYSNGPIDLVSAPGSGNYIFPLYYTLDWSPGEAIYNSNGGRFDIIFEGGDQALSIDVLSDIVEYPSSYTSTSYTLNINVLTAGIENKKIQMANLDEPIETSDTPDGVLRVCLLYVVIALP